MSDRFHRDDPKRSHPRRNMSEALRNDDPWRTRPPPNGSHQTGEDDFPDPDSVGEGVDDAYRVADDQMREGQWRARWHSQRGYDWRGYEPPFGPGYAGRQGPGRQADGLLEQVTRVYLDMMSLVGSMMNGLTRPQYPRSPYDGRREPEYPRPHDPPRGHSAGVRVEVTSNQTNQVVLDLKPLRPRLSLSVPPLRALNNGKPDLHDIQFETQNDRYVLRVRIPDKQPPGPYSGVIVEAHTREPCGTLAIQVGRPAPSRARAQPAKNHR